MNRVFAVTNNKGGVGKTHTVFHLAGAYAERGKRVLVIDLDPQMNLSGLFFDKLVRPALYDVLVEDVQLRDAIHATQFPGISAVHAGDKLQAIDALLQDKPDAQILLDDAIKELLEADAFDIVLLDCPPSLGLSTRNALAAAERVIIPIEADKFSVDGLDNLLRTIESMQRVVNPRLEVAGILISLFNGRRAVERLYSGQLENRKLPLFDVRIKDSTKYREAITARKPICFYLPKSEHADAFRSLMNELEPAHAH